MSKWVRVILMVLLLVPASAAFAQDAPDAIDDALADLSQRLGRQVTLASFSQWNWEQRNFTDNSLGCPVEGQTYDTDNAAGYIFTFTDYDNNTYEYRVALDRSYLALCVGGHPAEGTILPAGVEPQPVPASEAVACDFEGAHVNYMPTHLRVGDAAQGTEPNIPNNARREPTLAADVAFQVAGGDQFSITSGPMCAGGLVWWQVGYKNLSGWIAEGSDDEYWIEPVEQAQPAQPAEPVQPVQPAQPAQPTSSGKPAITPSNIGQMTEISSVQFGTPVASNLVLLAGGFLVTGGEDGKVTLWDAETGELANPQMTGTGHAAAITTLVYVLPDVATEAYPLLVSGDENGLVVVWDPVARAETERFEGHTAAITSLAISPNGAVMASGDANGAVRLWAPFLGSGLAVINAHNTPVTSLSFDADGAFLISGTAEGYIRVWGIAAQ